jgi:phosphomannomutase
MDSALVRDAAARWLAEDPDPTTRRELEDLLARHDDAALADRFGGRLEFGTAGLRGILGAGPNRMNRAVVIRTTAGLATYLLATVPDARTRGVVIGHDARHGSAPFAADAAAVLAGYGIPVHFLPAHAPTPLTAFAVKHLRAAAGVMVTASHNPPEYNGYKVYWGNGAQIVPPHDKGIAAAIDGIGPLATVPRRPPDDARAAGLLRDPGPEIAAAYGAAVRGLTRPAPEAGLTVVYTALHGVGAPFALEALREAGFERVFSVKAQEAPDPDFPTVRFPNPEEPGALDLALDLARHERADLVLANDPDADRLAVAVPDRDGNYRVLTGNQIGVLLGAYLLRRDPGADRLAITTIVSSPMLGWMCRKAGVRYAETLTGFKWIANEAMRQEAETGTRFVFGYEEALGYTVGTVVRDKDGISAAVLFAELAADARERGRTVLDELAALYREHGLWVSGQRSAKLTKEGMARVMEAFRAAPPAAIGGSRVVRSLDYRAGVARDAAGGETTLSLPKSNVLAFELENGARVTLRPSGTEPKIKYYFDLAETMRPGESLADGEARAGEALERLVADWMALVAAAGR